MPLLNATSDDASELFVQTCQTVAGLGQKVSPRGLPTVEILGAELVLSDPRRRLVDAAPVRILNPAFAAAEALWILSGSDDDWIFTFNERLRGFTDHGRLQGAYGPRLRRWRGEVDQLDVVRRRLLADPASRQAVITLFDPARDFSGYRDVPCTLGYRFALREGVLHMFTSMRSQDAWLGMPYDLFTFTILHELVAGWVGVGLGDYHHLIDSLHLYEPHAGVAAELRGHTASHQPQLEPLAVPWEDFNTLLAQVIAGEAVGSAGWDDFAVVLASYRRWKRRAHDDARTMVESSSGPLARALRQWYAVLETQPTKVADAPPVPGDRKEWVA